MLTTPPLVPLLILIVTVALPSATETTDTISRPGSSLKTTNSADKVSLILYL